jgi:hypothetical protein
MRIVIFILLVFLIRISNAQRLGRVSVLSGYGFENVIAHAIDSRGNTYVSFYTSGADVKPISVFGNEDIYNLRGYCVAKLDANRQLVWIRTNPTPIQAIALDKQENLVITGSQQASVFLLSKISGTDGTRIWEVTESSSGKAGRDLIVDNSNDIYVCGYEEGGLRAFASKFSASGVLQWTVRSTAGSSDGNALAFDGEGNILFGGNFHFNSVIGGVALPQPIGYDKAFIACITTDGVMKGVVNFGGQTGHVVLTDLATQSDGSIFFSGGFSATVPFGSETLQAAGGYDFYVAKLSAAQELQWIRRSGSNGYDRADYLQIVSDGILVSGVCSGEFNLGGQQLTGITANKAIVSKIRNDGTVEWLKDFGHVRNGQQEFFRLGYEIKNAGSDCFSVSGMFNGTLETVDGNVTASGSALADEEGFIGVLSLSTGIIDVGPDVAINICDENKLSIPFETSTPISHWETVSGVPPTATLDADHIQILNIAEGETVLKLSAWDCSAFDFRIITIRRARTPPKPATANYAFCATEFSTAGINVNGNAISWYGDQGQLNKLFEGNVFNPTQPAIVYVTDKVEGCESAPAPISISLKQTPPQPEITHVDACVDAEITLTAKGSNLKWYLTPEAEMPKTEEENYTTVFTGAGPKSVYVSQTVDGCESGKVEIPIDAWLFSMSDIFVSNVVTANGDALNDSFYIPKFPSEVCLGSFRKSIIFNRWGVTVSESDERDFVWSPGTSIPSGTYYYRVEFEKRTFQGSISVFR